MKYSALPTLVFAGALAVGAAACERDTSAREATRDAADSAREAAKDAAGTAREAARDTGSAVAGATETLDVKAALMRDDAVDASDINVDTDGTRKVVVLKGTVPTDAERARAEQIAMKEATGYRVDNQLVVRAR